MMHGHRGSFARPPLRRHRTPLEGVAVCDAFSKRLKEKPLHVMLHVSTGHMAEGTISLDEEPGKQPAKLVISAQGSTLFGLVKQEHQYVFNLGELERSHSKRTSFLNRSICDVSGGDAAVKDDMLARSLSLLHENEVVDMTCDSKEECDRLGEWIDAEWCAAATHKSFHENRRIHLALEGKSQSLEDRALYAASTDGEGDGDEGGGGGRASAAGALHFTVLPVLENAALHKLQDDLLQGVHVTYHKMSMGGLFSTSYPRRLRYDCQSKEGLVYLEASFEGEGKTIVHPLSELIQVGGKPSAHCPTAGLLRATEGDPQQRAGAVSLVFKKGSMDITCSPKNARELVLLFSAARGFTLGAPQFTSKLGLDALQEDGGGTPRSKSMVELSAFKKDDDLDCETAGERQGRACSGSPGKLPRRRGPPRPPAPVHPAGLGAVSSTAGGGGGDSSGGGAAAGSSGGGAAAGAGGAAARQNYSRTFSSRFRDGMEEGDDDKDDKLDDGSIPAASGFSQRLPREEPRKALVQGVTNPLAKLTPATFQCVEAGKTALTGHDNDDDGGDGGGGGIAPFPSTSKEEEDEGEVRGKTQAEAAIGFSLELLRDESRKALAVDAAVGSGSSGGGGGGGGGSARRLNVYPTFSSRFLDATEEEEEKTQEHAASGFNLKLLRDESRKALAMDSAAGGSGGGGGGGGGSARWLSISPTFSTRFLDASEEEEEKTEEHPASGFNLKLLRDESRKYLAMESTAGGGSSGCGGGGGGGSARRLNVSPTFSSRFLDSTEEEEEKTQDHAASGFSLQLLKEESRKALLKAAAASGGGGGGGIDVYGTTRRLSSPRTFSSRFLDGTEEEENEARGLLRKDSQKDLFSDEMTRGGGDGDSSAGDDGDGDRRPQWLEISSTFTTRFLNGAEVEEIKETRRRSHAASGYTLKLLSENSRKTLLRDATIPLARPRMPWSVRARNAGGSHAMPLSQIWGETKEEEEKKAQVWARAANGFGLQLLRDESRKALVPDVMEKPSEPATNFPSTDAGKVVRGRGGAPQVKSSTEPAAVISEGGGGNSSGGGGGGGGNEDGDGGRGKVRPPNSSPRVGSRPRDGSRANEDDKQKLPRWMRASTGFSLQLLKAESRRALVRGPATTFKKPPTLRRKWSMREKKPSATAVAWALLLR